jgi:ribosomal protein S18 acetylase RimI-like enzyme
MSAFTIRRAELKDAGDIARVRTTSWKQSYIGFAPDALLAKLDINADRQRIEAAMVDPASKTLRFVAEAAGKLVGMGSCGPAREQADNKRGEVYTLYLLQEAKGQGIGRALFVEMARQLAANGYASLQLNVLERNLPARGFYEKLGGKLVKEGLFKYDGFELPDVTYVWDDIGTLAKIRTLKSLLAEIAATTAFSDLEMSVNTKGIFGDLPIHTAATWGDTEAVEILLANGADINSIGDNGETPIFSALQADRESFISFLIAHGARTDIKNYDGETPADMAQIKGCHAIAALLKKMPNQT